MGKPKKAQPHTKKKAKTAMPGGKAGKLKLKQAKRAKDAEDTKKKEEGDWMGGVSDDEEDPHGRLAASDSDEEPSIDDGDDDQSEADAGVDAQSEVGSDGKPEPGQRGNAESRLLARVVAGEQPADITAIKQRIHDDSELLSNWRKGKKPGDNRTREQVLRSLVCDCSTYFGYAEELAEYFLTMFSPKDAISFFEANEKARPLTIRANGLKTRRQALMQHLTNRKVTLDPIGEWTKVGLKVYEAGVPVGATPEYLGGHYMIQSASSLIPVMALAPQQEETILDMAAAPGGKTTHIGQLMRNTGVLFANDVRKDRCKALSANCHRMGLTNTIITNLDGRKLGKMLPRLDRVLLDAPCTGSGIVSRDPSVKVKRGAHDFSMASVLQKEMLKTAIDLVDADSKTGGYVVYSTCSVSVEECEMVIDHILSTRNVKLVSFSSAVNFGVEGMTKFKDKRFHPSLNLCRRYYPHVHNMDGFFVAKLKKVSNKKPLLQKKDRSKTDHLIWGEEHWTPEMMETLVDFDKDGQLVASGEALKNKNGRPMNKIERKKLRRHAVLASRMATCTKVGAAVAEKTAAAMGLPASATPHINGGSATPGRPPPAAVAEEAAQEEKKEPEPEAEGAAKKKGLKRKSMGKAKAAAAEQAPQEEAKGEATKAEGPKAEASPKEPVAEEAAAEAAASPKSAKKRKSVGKGKLAAEEAAAATEVVAESVPAAAAAPAMPEAAAAAGVGTEKSKKRRKSSASAT